MNKIKNYFFNKLHGSKLIYNTCWEDPQVDKLALNLNQDSKIVVITSAGCNALDYLTSSGGKVFAVDMNSKQNALLELKVAAARVLSYEDYFSMFGEGILSNYKIVYYSQLRKLLSADAALFWDKKIKYFSDSGWRNCLYFHGASGFFAKLINFYIDKIIFARNVVNEMLAAKSIEKQRKIYFTKLKPRFWNKAIQKIVTQNFILTLLGVPYSQRKFLEDNYASGLKGYIEDCLDFVFGKCLLKNNYFWRVYLTGGYTRNCCPEYLKYENYLKIRNGLWQNLSIKTASLVDFLNESQEMFSHFVLLDHMDWLVEDKKHILDAEWQAITEKSIYNSRIIWRSASNSSGILDKIEVTKQNRKIKITDSLKLDYELAENLGTQDRVHTYAGFFIANMIN